MEQQIRSQHLEALKEYARIKQGYPVGDMSKRKELIQLLEKLAPQLNVLEANYDVGQFVRLIYCASTDNETDGGLHLIQLYGYRRDILTLPMTSLEDLFPEEEIPSEYKFQS